VRTVYIVSYDICDARRLRNVYRLMRGFGDHIQYSVFRCDLSAREVADLRAKLEPVIDHRADQVLLIDLGPPDGRASECIQSVGRAYTPLLRRPVIV
jgi:CRISPR-associated protein Cas2